MVRISAVTKISTVSATLFIFLVASLTFSSAAEATVRIPKNLDAADREQALRIIGFGTSSKILSDPFPLGGFVGIEVGLSVENLPTDELGGMGDRLAIPQQDVSYSELTLGKGLYYDVDLFIHFTPYNRADEISEFGGNVRWGFYRRRDQPLNAAVNFHFSSGNVANLLTTRSYGVDLIGGVDVKNVSLFAGFGFIEATGTFTGGPAGVTDTQQMESAAVAGLHTVVGATVFIKDFFLSLEIDRYTLPVFSGKVGVRF